jgi:hypothetical protein
MRSEPEPTFVQGRQKLPSCSEWRAKVRFERCVSNNDGKNRKQSSTKRKPSAKIGSAFLIAKVANQATTQKEESPCTTEQEQSKLTK